MAAAIRVILLDHIPRLGNLGDEVSVAAGFARNQLFRQHQALPATEANRAEFEKRRKELEAAQKEKLQAAQAQAEQWGELQLRLQVQAGPGGKMYGSVNTRDLVAALQQQGIDVENRQILLPYALRDLGDHSFAIQLHPQVRIEVALTLTTADSTESAATGEAV